MAQLDAARHRRSTLPYFAAVLILSLLLLLRRQSTVADLTAASLNLTTQRCNLTSAGGEWIRFRDPVIPRYSSACKEIFKGWSCAAKYNRDDLSRWIWKPNGCKDPIPRIDPIRFLNRFRDRSVGFVGDSLNRNMFVSMVCMLRHVAERGVRKWRPAGADRGFTFEKYNLTVAYHRTNLLTSYGGRQMPMEVTLNHLDINKVIEWTLMFQTVRGQTHLDFMIFSSLIPDTGTCQFYKGNFHIDVNILDVVDLEHAFR